MWVVSPEMKTLYVKSNIAIPTCAFDSSRTSTRLRPDRERSERGKREREQSQSIGGWILRASIVDICHKDETPKAMETPIGASHLIRSRNVYISHGQQVDLYFVMYKQSIVDQEVTDSLSSSKYPPCAMLASMACSLLWTLVSGVGVRICPLAGTPRYAAGRPG